MKNSMLLSVFFIFSISCGIDNNEIEIIEDSNGNTYSTIEIGNQTWMAENLNASNFNNGDPIVNINGSDEWIEAREPAWVYYDRDPSNGEESGKLYNWFAATDTRGICPTGWKVPERKDFEQLLDNFENIESAIDFMILETGFNAILGGYRQRIRGFNNKGIQETWWSTTPESYEYKYVMRLLYFSENEDYYDNDILEVREQQFNNGYNIRCIKS